MKRLLLDTNIIIDLLAAREPFFHESATLLSLADNNFIEVHASALTYANTYYILSKQLKPDEAKKILRKLKLIVHVLALSEKIIELSLNDSLFKDFEDALQYFSAQENEMDIIITRNLKDFQKSKLPVMTAGQFLKMN
jgi:predicted nucleic acid-binding protein